jgi:hypothetical protein
MREVKKSLQKSTIVCEGGRSAISLRSCGPTFQAFAEDSIRTRQRAEPLRKQSLPKPPKFPNSLISATDAIGVRTHKGPLVAVGLKWIHGGYTSRKRLADTETTLMISKNYSETSLQVARNDDPFGRKSTP